MAARRRGMEHGEERKKLGGDVNEAFDGE